MTGEEHQADLAAQAVPCVASSGAPTPCDSTFESQVVGIQKQFEASLRETDERAISLHCRYCSLALAAAVAGTLAVLLAILQLFVSDERDSIGDWLFVIEAVSAAIALAVVVYGIRWSIHHRWILVRHRAERLRALQAETYLRLFGLPLEEPELAARIDEARRIDSAGLKSWLQKDLVPIPLDARLQCCRAETDLTRFCELYTTERLGLQSRYLTEAGARHERLDHATRHLVPFFFFASVVCVGVHAALHLMHGEFPSKAAHVFLMLAACLPVVATGVKTYREAVQVSRNAARFSSKAAALAVLRGDLASAGSIEKALEVARHAEQVLESEHREWLRLMLDAEWF